MSKLRQVTSVKISDEQRLINQQQESINGLQTMLWRTQEEIERVKENYNNEIKNSEKLKKNKYLLAASIAGTQKAMEKKNIEIQNLKKENRHLQFILFGAILISVFLTAAILIWQM